jgi:hypothetical protein
MGRVEDAILVARPAPLPHKPQKRAEEEYVGQRHDHLATGSHELYRAPQGRPGVDQVFEDVRGDEAVEGRLGRGRTNEEGLSVGEDDAVAA